MISKTSMSSSAHSDKKGKDFLILDERLTQGLDATTLTAKAKCSINFTQSRKRFVLRLHYNGSKSLLFVQTKRF